MQMNELSKSYGLSLLGIFRSHSIFLSAESDFGALKMCTFFLPRYPDFQPTTKHVPGMMIFLGALK